MTRAALIAAANELRALSRAMGHAPVLREDSSREDVCRWLQACDPNGSHTDASSALDGRDPYTTDEAWDALDEMVNREGVQ